MRSASNIDELRIEFLNGFGGITGGKSLSAYNLAKHTSYLMAFPSKSSICTELERKKQYFEREKADTRSSKTADDISTKIITLHAIQSKLCNGKPTNNLKELTTLAIHMGSSASASMVAPIWGEAIAEHLHQMTANRTNYCQTIKTFIPPKIRKSDKTAIALNTFVDIITKDRC